MDPQQLRSLISAVASTIIEHADELTALDQAIGDGDHGLNMKRGCEAVLAEAGVLSAKPLAEAAQGIGMRLVMTIGGASGPLYGSLFLGLAKAVCDFPSRDQMVGACRSAVEAVAARGKSETGQKTMLDVLVPTLETFAAGKSLPELSAIANACAEATIPMKALRGRASFLGERSIGHMDPGARSSALFIMALAKELGDRP
jgi:phosphoenolpyruvate---glycerone phosphotransferase subunit DhaL